MWIKYLYLINDGKGLHGNNYKTLLKAKKNVKISPIAPYTIFMDEKAYLIFT